MLEIISMKVNFWFAPLSPFVSGVNECTLQSTIHDLPFGGVGNSGMGKYHGEWGFRAYSNARGVLSHSTKMDIGGLRYPPYDHDRILREIVMPS
jgi:aldehyde dehydrogenase (NAD+)